MIRFVMCLTTTLEQQSVSRHVVPLGYNILIGATKSLRLLLNAVCLAQKKKQ